MTKAMVVTRNGGPSVLKWREVEVGAPGPGEVRLRHTAVGLNFIDIYHRTGLYKARLPFTPGVEAAGVVEAVGRNVKGLKPGDRAAYMSAPLGAYAEARLYPADKLIKLPADVSDELAAAMFLKGMTCEVMLRRVHRVTAGETVLIHAASGGVGTIMTQWAKHLGATVIATVGSPAKARRARENGCDHVINYAKDDFVARVMKITKGAGVNAVYDSVGKATAAGSLAVLARLGTMVYFGNSSGPPPPVDPLALGERGLFVTRAGTYTYIRTRQEFETAARGLFRAWRNGAFRVEIGQRYALKDAARAQADLAARKTVGATVLMP